MEQAGLRALAVALSLIAWFWSQRLIGQRRPPEGGIGDAVHDLTRELHARLLAQPKTANAILIGSSLLIDLSGLFVLLLALLGPSLRPFVGLLILFGLRQACQALCSLPAPPGMIWRKPGLPSLLVTYGTATDLFFSGHTAIATLAALELTRVFGFWGGFVGAAVALLEMTVVLVLRAHYTMDVYAGLVSAVFAEVVAGRLAPSIDGFLSRL
jgi:hypothetical protein